jgi:hypothetical protein
MDLPCRDLDVWSDCRVQEYSPMRAYERLDLRRYNGQFYGHGGNFLGDHEVVFSPPRESLREICGEGRVVLVVYATDSDGPLLAQCPDSPDVFPSHCGNRTCHFTSFNTLPISCVAVAEAPFAVL